MAGDDARTPPPEASVLFAPHQRLARMAGRWEGLCRLWFACDMLAAETRQQGTLRPILRGRFLQHDYVWTFDDRPQAGIALLGHHIDEQRWECAWADSFHTGSSMMFSVSPDPPGSEAAIEVLGGHPGGRSRWGWRTRFEQPSDDRLLITMRNVSPEGEETVAVEVAYARVGEP